MTDQLYTDIEKLIDAAVARGDIGIQAAADMCQALAHTLFEPGSLLHPDEAWYLEQILPNPRSACDRAMAEALVREAIQITHENGTPEGTREAVMMTLRGFIGGLRMTQSRGPTVPHSAAMDAVSLWALCIDRNDRGEAQRDGRNLLRAYIQQQAAGDNGIHEPIQPEEEWEKENPASKALRVYASRWTDDIQIGGRGMTFDQVLAEYPEATAKSLLRMVDAARYYLDELPGLISKQRYSEVFHHVGHVEFEMKAIDRLARAHADVLVTGPADTADQ